MSRRTALTAWRAHGRDVYGQSTDRRHPREHRPLPRQRQLRSRRPRQRGVAVLLGVLGLLMVMTLTAVFTNRSLLFEQRGISNIYRSMRAFDAAEAGLAWTTMMLNDARPIDENCLPTLAGSSFRARYLRPDTDDRFSPLGMLSPLPPFASTRPACLIGPASLRCICPTTVDAEALSNAFAALVPLNDELRFGIEMGAVASSADAQSVSVVSHGCTNPASMCPDASAKSSGQLQAAAKVVAVFRLRKTLPPATGASGAAVGPISSIPSVITAAAAPTAAASTARGGVMVLVPGTWHDF